MFGTYPFLVLMIIGSVTAAIGGLCLVRSRVDHKLLTDHHDVAGFMLSIVGTLYAVVLGMLVVNSLNTFQQARIDVMHEANSLHDIFRTAHGLPAPDCGAIRKACREYAQTMVDDEWKSMEDGKASPHAGELMRTLWRCTVDFKPQTTGEEDVQRTLLQQMNTLSDSRQTRLIGAQPAFDEFIWTVLIFGGVVLVVFTYFFGVERLAVQIVMTAMVALSLTLNMSIVLMFGYPYSGDVNVSSQPFASDINMFNFEASAN